MDQVSELFDKMNIGRDKVESVRRFREKDGNTAPILVRLKEGTDRIKVVTAAKRIKDLAGYLGVFVNLDLTVTERELDKKLRFERDRLNKDEEQKGRHFYYLFEMTRLLDQSTDHEERNLHPIELQPHKAIEQRTSKSISDKTNLFYNLNKDFNDYNSIF